MQEKGRDSVVYIGSFFAGDDRGIRGFRFDSESGALEPCLCVSEGIESALYLEVDHCGRALYAADCLEEWRDGGAISAFAIDSGTGELHSLGRVPSCGTIPVHLSVSNDDRFLLAANCGSWSGEVSADRSVAVFPIAENGSLGEATSMQVQEGSGKDLEKQTSPHPHALVLDPRNTWALVPDLGADRVLIRGFDSDTGALGDHEPGSIPTAPGSGPRHLRFHPSGKTAYVIAEIASTVIVYEFDSEQGTLREVQTVSTLPSEPDLERNAAELRVHPSGRFVFASNRGHDSIAAYRVDPGSGELDLVGHTHTGGETPRSIAIDPSGRYLLVANERSSTMHSFAIDRQSGNLTPTQHVTEVPNPACIAFVSLSGQ